MAQERPPLVIIQTPGRLCGEREATLLRGEGQTFLCLWSFLMRFFVHVCVYCKPLLLVIMKWTNEQGVGLLSIYMEKRVRIFLFWSNVDTVAIKTSFFTQIPGVTNCLHAYVILALHPSPASHFMINGSRMRWVPVADSGTINAPLFYFSP